MIEIDPSISDDTIVWRYMDLTKFLSLLTTKKLFFPHVNNFNDPYDSSAYLFFKQQYQDPQVRDFINNNIDQYKVNAFVSCWHENNDQSAAQWKLYMNNDEGIAIKTTIKRIMEAIYQGSAALNKTQSEHINIHKVNYVKPESIKTESLSNLIKSIPNSRIVLTKRKSFEHEREIRLWIDNIDPGLTDEVSETDSGVQIIRIKSAKKNIGLKIDVDIEMLIDKVYVNPLAPAWVTNTIQETVGKLVGNDFKLKVQKSDLYTLE